jgi:DNA-binding response OmpR family regulator
MGKPILLVDDDAGIQDLVKMTLEDEGYAVLVAKDGQDALEILKSTTPALILLDYMMPRMNGAEFVQEAEKQDLRDAIPLVLLTAAHQAPSRAQEIGTDGYVGKPFDITVLLQTIDRLINP